MGCGFESHGAYHGAYRRATGLLHLRTLPGRWCAPGPGAPSLTAVEPSVTRDAGGSHHFRGGPDPVAADTRAGVLVHRADVPRDGSAPALLNYFFYAQPVQTTTVRWLPAELRPSASN